MITVNPELKPITNSFLVYVIIGSINAIPNGIKTTKDLVIMPIRKTNQLTLQDEIRFIYECC